MFDANVSGPLFITQAVLKVIRRGGRIIIISSGAGKAPVPSPFILYGMAKAAVMHMANCLALEYAERLGITINTVMPGPTATDALDAIDEDTLNRLKNTATAEKRLGTVEEVAHVVTFIAEDRSRWVNGDTISASGGVTSY